MLYQLAFTVHAPGSSPGRTDALHHYAEMIVEAPAHQKGELPTGLVDEAIRLAGVEGWNLRHDVLIEIKELRPRRFGYRAGNTPHAVTSHLAECRMTARRTD